MKFKKGDKVIYQDQWERTPGVVEEDTIHQYTTFVDFSQDGKFPKQAHINCLTKNLKLDSNQEG